MTAAERCLRCGHQGTDVAAKLVNLEAEAQAEGTRVRSVEVVQEIEHRHVTERRAVTVPERFGAEWRCRDRAACDARLAGVSPMAVPPPAASDGEEEVPSWL